MRRHSLPGERKGLEAAAGGRASVRMTIEGSSHDGRGLARIDGKVAFVAGALPGETISARLLRRHRRHDDYEVIEIATAASERVVPPCPLAGTCGGCDQQHLALEAQLRHKTEVVLELLERQARLAPERMDTPLASAPFGYRRRARLAVWTPPRGGQPVVGFRAAGSHRLVAVDVCPVLVPRLQSLPGPLREVLGTFSRPANVEWVEVAISEASDGSLDPSIHIRGSVVPGDDDLATLETFAAAQDAYLSIEARDGPWLEVHRPRPLDPGYLLPEFGLRIAFRGGDFVQANGAVNRRLVSRASAWLDDYRAGRLVDAFAGIGNFSLALARRGFPVLGIDAVPGMVGRAARNARDNGIDNVEFQVRDLLGRSVGSNWGEFDVAVLDPPRSGAHTLVKALAKEQVATILYVSCAAPTLARDAAVLAAADYRLARLALVDMFPQTSHVETMALFTRHPRGRPGGGRR